MSSQLPGDPQGRKKAKAEPFGDLMKTMNDFFQEKPVKGFLQTIDDFFRTPFPSTPSFHVETLESPKEIIINAELPGVKKEQIQIDIRGNYLNISVDQSELILEEDEVNQTYRKKQFRQKSSRTIALPQPINEKNIKASYRDGLLQIRLPRVKGKTINIEE
ncbi:Hsp20/alpha crystallin family protein [Neobacillus sp. PS3-34]|uniref:Hsp20/alpha crystallin family protein n=1 Tax=Neobacillus sp. PS3-34 TaxID=3070678 RepID=UPI0027DF2A95|nr:Hsp20/alpha crystallin family protein [Neobacillus sp. PS3-34]WML47731.1 Hsp20/alpha crystallin family protein [Neobacillus sp. PS3-34]